MNKTFYTCLNFLPSQENPKLCTLCRQPIEEHPWEMGTWTPPPIDDEYREKRSIELVQLRGPEDDGK